MTPEISAELVELRKALEHLVHIVGHNSCTDGKTPNGFSVALDHGRKALDTTPLSKAALMHHYSM